MYARNYLVSLCRHEENFSGLRFTETMESRTAPLLKPTVANIKSTIQAMFPGFTIDERWQSIREQIADSAEGLECFTISLQAKEPVDFESWYAEFIA